MRSIDYDTEQYQDYARGRALNQRQLQVWISAFAAVLPDRRPLAGLDVGSGTGRFTPALAEAFGPVTGIEPSVRMREVAQARSQHPGVRYLAGSAEDLPVPPGSADYALMFLSWHHVQDKPRAIRELARVLRPGGRLLLRGNFSTAPGLYCPSDRHRPPRQSAVSERKQQRRSSTVPPRGRPGCGPARERAAGGSAGDSRPGVRPVLPRRHRARRRAR